MNIGKKISTRLSLNLRARARIRAERQGDRGAPRTRKMSKAKEQKALIEEAAAIVSAC
ncbi:hypothetical protein HETIRDRAFT_423634 [Heterobasidion irregulare TC 32-1]|uniref:Uncharacterized protein n=1 Tax=Heterobasidion irregulare (strain TC 32-1) TaxID=747525 RepID=W4JNL0_HETIT|nr:uncharacterized protein HETIRDRAFT_423634 [Heterobasidion irregulare TC 32-1]ETW75069.1 hypothetical protein HETIRDRAFT_423634 [Heterobasidion irregulare TC 32-1]